MRDIAAMRDFLSVHKPRLRQIEDLYLNGETDIADLAHPLTPTDALFVRNNGDLPTWQEHEREHWALTIDGEVKEAATLSLTELKARYDVHTQTAVIECAGNGRALLDTPAEGLQWQRGAVGCVRWTGFRLSDVLRDRKLASSAVYCAFESPDRLIGAPDKPAFSRGIPLDKALADETMLAFGMNDRPLPALHGGPLRVVVPGFPGSAWQKWVTRLWVRDREHDGVKMTGLDYRIDGKVITDMPVKSMITAPLEGFTCARGSIIPLSGFAWSGHVPVGCVDISCDGGDSWIAAELAPPDDRFCWRAFRADIAATKAGPISLIARATDVEGQTQPLGNAAWNPKGYCNNSAHRISGSVVLF
jgi:sulfite oxidase